MSRLNYDKVYTVEHNLKVYEFGEIRKEHLSRFLRNWRKVWQELHEADDDEDDSDDSDADEDDNEVDAGEGGDPEANPQVMIQHNLLVNRYVNQWRALGTEEDLARADYLLHASYLEQVNYLTSCGAYRNQS